MMRRNKIEFPKPVPIKSDYLKKNFTVEAYDKKAVVSVEIINKNLIIYDDAKLKRTFKRQARDAESVLDAMILNYIGGNLLEAI